MGRPRNLTYQQEEFAQHIASGMSQSEAYRKAYPTCLKWPDKVVWSKASVMARHESVVARIAEIRQPAVVRVQDAIVYTAQVAMEEAREALELAKKTLQPGSMVAAVQLRAKLNGLLIDRKEMGNPGEFQALDALRKQDAIAAIQAEVERRQRLTGPAQPITDVVPKQ